MVISFSCERARQYLMAQDRVFTWRRRRRKVVGRNWMNRHRGGYKLADVFITEIGEYPIKELEPWVPESGFHSLDEWYEAIREENKTAGQHMDDTRVGWLYLVTIR